MIGLKEGKWIVIASLALLISGCGGCESRASTDGEQGNLRFFYSPADGSTQFDRPIATGSSLLLEVAPLGDRELESLTAVSTSSDSVLSAQILSPVEPSIQVVGRSRGSARITVDARGGGETYQDSTSFRVDDVYEAELRHLCTNEASAAYVIDENLSLAFTRRSRNGDTLAGFARSNSNAQRTCQVFLEPEFYQDQVRCDESGLHFQRESLDVAEDIWIDVANGISTPRTAHRELGIQMIGPDMIDFQRLDADLRVDLQREVEVVPFAYNSGLLVCSHLAMRVFIDTPNICTGPNGAREFDVLPEDMNRFSLRGHRQGNCELTIILQQQPGIEFLLDAQVYAQ